MAGAIGSAMTAFVGLGIEKEFSKIKELNPVSKTYFPRKDHKDVYQKMFENYKVVYYSLKKAYYNINFARFNKN